MSVGMFLGIRPSFLPDFQDEAEKFICEINSALRILGRPPYLEPRVLPNPYINGRFGRSSLDNNSAEALAALAAYCVDARCANLDILAANPYRIAFLPTHVSDPIETDYVEQIGDESTPIWAGSLPALMIDMCSVAKQLDIPLEDGSLSDDAASRINDYEPFFVGDSCPADHRTAWLMVYEGCRIAISFQLALSFAG